MGLLVQCSGLTESAENQSIDPGFLNHLENSDGAIPTSKFNFDINLFRMRTLSAPFSVCEVAFTVSVNLPFIIMTQILYQ